MSDAPSRTNHRQRLIIDAPHDRAADALRLLLDNLESLKGCQVGHGWGFWRSGDPEVHSFIRRTKTGASIVVQVKSPSQDPQP